MLDQEARLADELARALGEDLGRALDPVLGVGRLVLLVLLLVDDDQPVLQDDDEIDPDDVEAGLDVILKDRLVVADEEEDEEDEVPDIEDRAEGPAKVLPKRPGEFVCQSCFLVKHPSQLADPERMFCRDCV